jgi:PPOX class probable F420-dependent enzyme
MNADPATRLHDERNVWMATTRPDGRPHLAPVWFVAMADRIWVGTGAGSVRVRNIAANPAVSLSLEDGDAPIVGEGTATVHPTDRPADVAAAFLAKYGWDITLPEDPDVGTVVLVEIAVTKWLFGVQLPTADKA